MSRRERMTSEYPLEQIEQDKRRLPWLHWLGKAYALADERVGVQLRALKAQSGKAPACRAGCHACCLRPNLAVTQIEFQGISWYLSEVVSEPTRGRIREQVRDANRSLVCPFLVDGNCGIYPMRPLICRQFHVLNEACTPEEDPIRSRPDDCWYPTRDASMKIATILLQGMGCGTSKECDRLARDGALATKAKEILDESLEFLGVTMDMFAARRG